MKTLKPEAMHLILLEVHSETGVTPRVLRGPGRGFDTTSWARHAAFALAREHTVFCLEWLGDFFGRNHATIMNGVQAVKDSLWLPDAVSQARARSYFRMSARVQRRIEILEAR